MNTQSSEPRTLTEDEARGGVTGHGVRHVLAFGLFGAIAAFVAIGIYFGYDHVGASFSNALSLDPAAVLSDAAPFALIILLGGVAGVLLLKLWSAVSGPGDTPTQTGMRVRVVVQLIVVSIIMAFVWVSAA